ncbi:hypothetical protein NXY56_002721 [Leishmania guyanensis]
MGNTSSNSSSLSHPAVGGRSRRQRNRDSQVRSRPAGECLPEDKHSPATTSTAVTTGVTSPHVTTLSPLVISASPTGRQHRDAMTGAIAASSVTQGIRFINPVPSTHQHGRHALSSLPAQNVDSSPACATATAATESQHSSSEGGHLLRGSRGRERSCNAELSPPQRHRPQQRKVEGFADIGVSRACQAHGDGDNVNGCTAQRGSVADVHGARSSSILQTATGSTVLLSLTTPLSLEGTYFAATEVGTVPLAAGGHTREALSVTRGSDTEVDMDEHYITSYTSLQVDRAVSRSTSILNDEVLPESSILSCSPSTAASLLPLPVGRAARFIKVSQSLQMTKSTAGPQWPDESLDEGVVSCGRIRDKSDRKSKTESISDGSSGGSGCLGRRQSRSTLFRKLVSRSGSRAELSKSPSRCVASEGGGNACGVEAKLAAEEDSHCSEDPAATASGKRDSLAPRVTGLPPSSAPVPLDTQPRPSKASLPFPTCAAPTPPTSSMTAQRPSVFQSPAAEGRPDGRTATHPTVDNVRSHMSGSKGPRAAEDMSEPGPSRVECGASPQRDLRDSEGASHSLNLVSETQVACQNSEESDSTTPTDTNSAPILPPPPTDSFAEAVWGTRGAASPGTPTTPTNSTSLFSDYGHDNGNNGDCAAVDASPLLMYYSHQQPLRRKVPGILGTGVFSTTTVTDTTARVSPQSPSVSPLKAVAAAGYGDSAAAVAAAHPSLAAAAIAAGARVKGRRSVSQSVIIAAWNRMGARTGDPASGIGAGGGHHGGDGSPDVSAEILQATSAPENSIGVGGGERTAAAVPASSAIQFARLPAATTAEMATGETSSPCHQGTFVGDQEADNPIHSRRSRAGAAVVLPVRRRSVLTRQRGPPPLFSPSPEGDKSSDAVSQSLSVFGQSTIHEGAHGAVWPALPPAFTHAAGDTAASRAAAPPQELQRPREVRAEGEEKECPAPRAPLPPRGLPADLRTLTTTSLAFAAQWSSRQESRRGDASMPTTQLRSESILAIVDCEDRSGRGLVGGQEQLPILGTTEYNEEMESTTTTTVDADEEDRGNEEGGVAEGYTAQRSPQTLAQHKPRWQRIDVLPRRISTTGFTTTHTTVVTTSARTGLLPAHTDRPYYAQPRFTTSSSFAPSTSAAAPIGAIAWVHSSPSSPRSYSTIDSRLETAASAENVAKGEKGIDEFVLSHTQGGGAVHCPLHRSGDSRLKRFVGFTGSPLHRRFLSPPVLPSRSDSTSFNTIATAPPGGSRARGAALVRSNSCQPPRRYSQQAPTRNTSFLSSKTRLMPQWRERLTPTPKPTSPLSWNTARDDMGGAAGGFQSTPWGRRGLTSQGTPPLAHQPSAYSCQPPPPPMLAALPHLSQRLWRANSDSLNSVRWQEVSLQTSGRGASSNFGFAGSSRDKDDTPPRYYALGDEGEYIDAVVNGDNAEDSGDHGAQWCHGFPLSGAAGKYTRDDGDETLLWWESSGAPVWSMTTSRTWRRGDEDDENGREEEGDEGEASENDAGSCSNSDSRIADRHRPRLPKSHHCRRSVALPSASVQLPPHESHDVCSTPCDFGPLPLSEQSSPRSRACVRAFADSAVSPPPTWYEPPMPSNQNTFTAFVHLSDISASQLLAAAATAFQCGRDAHLRRASPGVHGEGGRLARSREDTPATADTLIVSGYTLSDAYLTDGADARADAVSAAGGALPITPLNYSVNIPPTNHVSRADTPVLVAPHGSVARQTSQSAVTEVARTRSESLGALSGGTPAKSRGSTKAPLGLNDAAATSLVDSNGSVGGCNDDSDGGSEDSLVTTGQLAVMPRRTSLSLEPMRVVALPVSEGERHALSEEKRPWLGAFLHLPASFHSAANAATEVTTCTTLGSLFPRAARLPASQTLPDRYLRVQRWWNRHRCTPLSEGSGPLDLCQRVDESVNGDGGGIITMSDAAYLDHLTHTKSATVPVRSQTVAPPLFGLSVGCAESTAAGCAGPHSGSCSCSSTTCVAGSGGEAVATPTAIAAATSLAIVTSRESCGSLVSPLRVSELLLMPRHEGDAVGGSGGTSSGPGLVLMDERVAGVVEEYSSGSGAEVASADFHEEAPTTSAVPAVAVPLFPPRLGAVAADSSGFTGAHEVKGGNVHDGHAALHVDSGVTAEHGLPHPPLTTELTDSRLVATPLTTSHHCVDGSSTGEPIRVTQIDSSPGEQKLFTVQRFSSESSQPTMSCAAGPLVSPIHVPVRSLLHLHGEAAVDTCAVSRAQARPSRYSRLVMSPSPLHGGSTPRVRAHLHSQHQRRGPSIGQVVCRWCGEPYASEAVCSFARRPHSVLREERRIEKSVKRKAQSLLCEGQVTEAVALLRSAGVCAL